MEEGAKEAGEAAAEEEMEGDGVVEEVDRWERALSNNRRMASWEGAKSNRARTCSTPPPTEVSLHHAASTEDGANTSIDGHRVHRFKVPDDEDEDEEEDDEGRAALDAAEQASCTASSNAGM